ncbi:N-acetylmuramoyl-L-alanine amidase [Tabrizicola sp.]|uniref:N-acetylmuramoyl-L-alanine amidase n=1 Tax=Tabrizicola sp. TaxID=2005166 RepID=UPI0035B0EA00
MTLLRPLLMLLLLALSAAAQDLSALAKVNPLRSGIVALADGGLELKVALSQPVPWRLRLMDNPPRLVIDAREIDWRGVEALAVVRPGVSLRAGAFRPGWSRLVMELAGPLKVERAEMVTGDDPRIELVLAPTDAASFAREAARPDLPDWALPEAAELTLPRKEGSGPLVVVLDPGHGGIDPGAEREGQSEAALMLTFARELKEALVRDGRFKVVLTRDEDVFVPLETRTSIAREAGADVFLALHADALAEGDAQGATVYTLAAEASDEASAALAERHDRDDLLAGVDLSNQDDVVAEVLMDMARTETQPRAERLADAIVTAIKAAKIRMHRHPHQSGGFSVLKSPDIPAVLLEVGFLSSDRDFKRLADPAWRAKLAGALVQSLASWSAEDAVLRAAAAP